MDHLTLLEHAESQLVQVIHGLDEAEMDVVTNCPPWTIRRLASHALKNQLVWAGSASDQQLMPLDEAMEPSRTTATWRRSPTTSLRGSWSCGAATT